MTVSDRSVQGENTIKVNGDCTVIQVWNNLWQQFLIETNKKNLINVYKVVNNFTLNVLIHNCPCLFKMTDRFLFTTIIQQKIQCVNWHVNDSCGRWECIHSCDSNAYEYLIVSGHPCLSDKNLLNEQLTKST